MTDDDLPLLGFVVLVVEDDSDTRDALAKLIREALGCNVLCASDGVEALEIIDSARVDLVLTDIMMPTMDGLTLTDELRKRLLQIPVVFATGLPMAMDAALERGAVALGKPYTFDQLSAVLGEQLGADTRAC